MRALPAGTAGAVRRRLEPPAARPWHLLARPEQLEPAGEWRTWYIRGGRGSGKTRTGAETLAEWVDRYPAGEWAIIAPTFGDARSVCVEGDSGLLKALGGDQVAGWNRSEGVVTTRNGSRIYLDGANDGAFRIQGHGLRGAWCDEVGLWERWDAAWNESLAFAVREDPGRIIATGTPKMAHPLVAYLLEASNVAHTHMRTSDNIANLHPAAVQDLFEQYDGTTLGRQELLGEFIEALEGNILPRHKWEFTEDATWPVTAKACTVRFEQIIHSWDTALKAKSSSDNVAGQVWGCVGPHRYLLELFCGHASLEATVLRMRQMLEWAREQWPNTPHRVLIETASNGADAIAEMRRRVDGVYGYNPRDGGDKARRAMTAAPALETSCCHLPGFKDHDPTGRGYTADTPPLVQAFVEECAAFRHDLRHAHDDQVDAWSQMVNWARGQKQQPARLVRPGGPLIRPGSLSGT